MIDSVFGGKKAALQREIVRGTCSNIGDRRVFEISDWARTDGGFFLIDVAVYVNYRHVSFLRLISFEISFLRDILNLKIKNVPENLSCLEMKGNYLRNIGDLRSNSERVDQKFLN